MSCDMESYKNMQNARTVFELAGCFCTAFVQTSLCGIACSSPFETKVEVTFDRQFDCVSCLAGTYQAFDMGKSSCDDCPVGMLGGVWKPRIAWHWDDSMSIRLYIFLGRGNINLPLAVVNAWAARLDPWPEIVPQVCMWVVTAQVSTQKKGCIFQDSSWVTLDFDADVYQSFLQGFCNHAIPFDREEKEQERQHLQQKWAHRPNETSHVIPWADEH